MSMDSAILWVAQVASPRTDPAFDLTAPTWDAAAKRYVKTRSAKDLAALPTKPGRKPRLWGVRLITPSEYATILAVQNGAQRAQVAFAAGCHQRIDPNGITARATLLDRPSRESPEVSSGEWVTEAQRLRGHQLIEEVASVVIRRAEIGDIEDEAELEDALRDPFALYGLPRGLTLSRSAPSAPPADATSSKSYEPSL